MTELAVERAKIIKSLGFYTYDALHIACAEQATVDVFLSTDDRLLRTAGRQPEMLSVRVMNPLAWVLEGT